MRYKTSKLLTTAHLLSIGDDFDDPELPEEFLLVCLVLSLLPFTTLTLPTSQTVIQRLTQDSPIKLIGPPGVGLPGIRHYTVMNWLNKFRLCQALHDEHGIGPIPPPVAQAHFFLNLVMSNQNEPETWREPFVPALVHRLIIFFAVRGRFQEDKSSTSLRQSCEASHRVLRLLVRYAMRDYDYSAVDNFIKYLDGMLPDAEGKWKHI